MKLNLRQLAEELLVEANTLRIWLDNYVFNKYRLPGKPISYEVNSKMLTDLEVYVMKKRGTSRINSVLWRLRWMKSKTCFRQ